MPLIVLTGYPSSGKTFRCEQIKKYFQNLDKTVHVVSENDVMLQQEIDKNTCSFGKIEVLIRRILLTSCVINFLLILRLCNRFEKAERSSWDLKM